MKLQTKDVFTHHLETIRIYLNAQSVCVKPCEIKKKVDLIAVGSNNDELMAFADTHVNSLSGDVFAESDCNNMVFYCQSDTSMLVKISQNTVAMGKPQEVASGLFIQKEGNGAATSRRSSIQTFESEGWFWLHISFKNAASNYFNGLDADEFLHFNQALLQLLKSTSLQMQLVTDYDMLLADPLTQLCSRTILQNKIAVLSKQHSIGLIMIHCIDFYHINKKFGHDQGDAVIREIANKLSAVTREDDVLSRFGGALFGVAFPVNEQSDINQFARKLQASLQDSQYLDGAINLHFDLGAALINHDEAYKTEQEKAAALINLADHALKASKVEEQPAITVWQNEDMQLQINNELYTGGIFTADTVTDYRNMLLLWDLSTIIADNNSFTALLKSAVERMAQTFDFQSAGLISANSRTIYSLDERDNAQDYNESNSQYLANFTRLQQDVALSNTPKEMQFDDSTVLALPMDVDSEDCFFVCGKSEHFDVTTDTKALLLGLTRQLGKALRRSRLEEALNQKLENQNKELQNELVQLKEGLQVSNIIYQSAPMRNLMKHAQRAAMTDTTVLITGESGTGKERLINALHQLGNRKAKPFVIVDCGSIPETLIESELFGYVKGAFTGAQNNAKGKILEADGGVLVLDEIGELPIQMQSKLLRFVQEKHFTQVGGNKVHTVDVKIVAVTNRDLAQEVELGNFRKDLYYRLNVLSLHNPPLRERLDDVPLLASHFLKKFAEQFNSDKKQLTPDTLQKMQQYAWPGNIRELENRLMQATLLAETNSIDWALLNIEEDVVVRDTHIEKPTSAIPNVSHIEPISMSAVSSDPAPVTQNMLDTDACLTNLTLAIKEQITHLHSEPQFFNAPIGTWIEDELAIQAYIASGGKMRTTASRLHISLSTARRRVDKIMKERAESMPARPAQWQSICDAVKPIADGRIVLIDCMAKLKKLMLEVILTNTSVNMTQAAEMLGVSEPTLYKIKREID